MQVNPLVELVSVILCMLWGPIFNPFPVVLTLLHQLVEEIALISLGGCPVELALEELVDVIPLFYLLNVVFLVPGGVGSRVSLRT